MAAMEEQPTMESVLNTLRELQKQEPNDASRPQPLPETKEVEPAIGE